MKIYFDIFVIYLSVVLYFFLELFCWFICFIEVFCDFVLYLFILWVNCCINYFIFDCFGDNVFCVFFWVEVEFDIDIGKGNVGVSKSDGM